MLSQSKKIGYLEKSGEGKQEECVKVQDSWPPNSDCSFWLKGHKTEISIVGLDLKVLVLSYLLTTFDLKLEAIVFFLRVKSDLKATRFFMLIISPKTSNQNLEIVILFIVVEGLVFEEDIPQLHLSGKGFKSYPRDIWFI